MAWLDIAHFCLKELPTMTRTTRLCLALALASGATLASRAQVANPTVFINEFHYDNASTDSGEFIEIAGPAETDLTGYSVVLYNGSATSRAPYNTVNLTGTIPEQQNGYGTVVLTFPSNGIQNGDPDGIALVSPAGLIQFLSYEGTFEAASGPAVGVTSVDIGVRQDGTDPAGSSLQLQGSGTAYSDFQWVVTTANTAGAVNTNQTFGGSAAPTLSINDVSVTEGDSGTTNATFTISLTSAAGPGGVSFNVATADASASAGSDYAALSANVTIPEGSSNHTIDVLVIGDTLIEGDESFTLVVSNVVNADVGDSEGIATVVDNDEATAPATFVVVNEIDSDTPGSDAAEFVELFDGGAGHTPLSGLTAVFYNGSNDTSYAAFDLDGQATNADGYFTLGNTSVPGVDLVFSGNLLQNGADAVALYVGNAIDFPAGTPVTTNSLVDALVYDTADPDDPGLLTLINTGQPQSDENSGSSGASDSLQRCPNGAGGARNTSGYRALAPTPDTVNGPCPEPPPPAVRRSISEIQGGTDSSPFAGTDIITTGVVTGRKTNGFFLQSLIPDGDANTSDAVFVFTNTAPEVIDSGAARLVAPGDVLDVTGRVVEFRRASDARPETLTEISGPLTLTLLEEAQPLPPAVDAATIFDPSAVSRVAQLEAFESMLVMIGEVRAVTPTNNFGEFFAVLAGTPRPFREPGITSGDPLPFDAPMPNNIPTFDGNFERIMIESDEQTDDTGTRRSPVVVATGAMVSGAWGPLDYAFDEYRIQADASAPLSASGGLAAAVPVPQAAANEFTIAAANLLNFTNPDATRLTKAAMMIRDVLRTPAILGVIEVGDLASLQQLADAVNGSAGTSYQALFFPAAGSQHLGYLVDAARVDIVEGPTQLFAGKTFTFAGVEDILHDRPPLVMKVNMRRAGVGQSFPVTVMLLHLKSLIDVDSTEPIGAGQTLGARNREKRRLGAEDVAQAIEDREDENLVVLGDLNAFEFNDGYVDVVGTLRGAPAAADEVVEASVDEWDHEVFDLIDTIANAEQRYSYSFGGNAQVLDHVLVNAPMLARLSRFHYARNNVDFPAALSTDGSRPERFSDHDAPVAYFTFPALADLSVATTTPLSVDVGVPFTYSVTVTNAGPDPAEHVTLTIPALSGLGNVSLTAPPGWSCTAAGDIACMAATLPVGVSASFTVQASAACSVPNGTLIAQAASVSTSTPEISQDNNLSGYEAAAANAPPRLARVAASERFLIPNHHWVPVTVDYAASDSCGAVTTALSVSSTEAVTAPVHEQGLAGRTSPDWEVVDAHTVRLRAERSPKGEGRIYTITITATDEAGGTTTEQVTVAVPKQVGATRQQ
jgi:predicted extracellular nuclease